MSKKRFRYDVALSFAGEDAAIARRVYRELRKRRVAAFFSRVRTPELWGKDEQEFNRIYGPDSRFVMPFISEDYVRKEWPRREFRAARKEAQVRGGAFILPVRIDESRLPGLRTTVQYLNWQEYSAREIADFFVSKLAAAGRREEAPIVPKGATRVISATELELLGLIATTSFPLSLARIEALVPAVNWRSQVARWRRSRLLQPSEAHHLALTPRIRREVLTQEADVLRYRERWIEILEPLRAHIDTGLMLALQYAILRRVSKMVGVIVPIAEGLEPGFWNGLYRDFLKTLDKAPLFRRITGTDRIQVLNAYGLVLSRGGEPGKALSQFQRLRILSKRHGDIWGEGQSYINAGVAAAQIGRGSAAIKWYEKAVALGQKSHDSLLAGRALGNLSTFAEDPKKAAALLKESERLLTRAGDSSGLVGALLQRGYLAASTRDFRNAAKHYRKAAKLARKVDLRHKRCLALLDLARTQVDLGRPTQAYPFYVEARRIAAEEGFTDEEVKSCSGKALAHLEAKEFGRAARGFSELASLYRSRSNLKGEVIALHDVGAARLLQGRRAVAYQAFARAVQEARRRGVWEWVYRSQMDASRAAPNCQAAIALLRAARRGAQRKGDDRTALEASIRLAEHYSTAGDVEGVLRELINALRPASPADRLRILADRFRVLLETGKDRRIAAGLRAVREAAQRVGDWQCYTDIHMALGDYQWRKGDDERVNAYQAYVVAMLKAVVHDFEVALRVGSHILLGLLRIPADSRDRLLSRLEHRIPRWLKKQRVLDAPRVVAFSLFPVRLARRVTETPDGGRHLSAKETTQMLIEEVTRGEGSNNVTKASRPTNSSVRAKLREKP